MCEKTREFCFCCKVEIQPGFIRSVKRCTDCFCKQWTVHNETSFVEICDKCLELKCFLYYYKPSWYCKLEPKLPNITYESK